MRFEANKKTDVLIEYNLHGVCRCHACMESIGLSLVQHHLESGGRLTPSLPTASTMLSIITHNAHY